MTPQVAPSTHPSRMRKGAGRIDKEGEIDLPREHIPAAASGEPLPAPTQGYSVLIQGRAAPIRAVLTMHRIPFWVGHSDGATQRAVVMYVAPVAGYEPQRFFPSGSTVGGGAALPNTGIPVTLPPTAPHMGGAAALGAGGGAPAAAPDGGGPSPSWPPPPPQFGM